MINSMILVQQNLVTILLGIIEKIVSSSNNVDIKYSNDVIKILEDLKNSLELCYKNIALLRSKQKEIETRYEENSNYIETIKIVNQNTITVERFLHSLLDFTQFSFTDTPIDIKASKDEKITDDLNTKDMDLKENTLVISETTGKVTLPYTKVELEKIKSLNDGKTYEEIIKENYTLPLEQFKTPFVARFREAFKLIHSKEKKSVKAAFDLGSELMFNHNLHPAIIAACRNLDELDIYLDYLENNETDKFDCFNIIFEIPPTISKNKKL